MSFADELKALALTAPRERDIEDVLNEESAAKVTSASTDYELLPFRTNTTLLNEPIYRGRVVSRKEMMLEDEKFPDERFELDPDLYDIQGEDDKNDTQESDSDELDDTGEEAEQSFDEKGSNSSGVEELNEDAVEAGKTHSQHEKRKETSNDKKYNSTDYNLSEDSESDKDDNVTDCDSSQSMNRKTMHFTGKIKFDAAGDKFKHLKESMEREYSASEDFSEDVQKGRCIGHQLKVWDRLLEHRIQFQRILALSNQLPPFHVFKNVTKEFFADSDNNRLYRQTIKNAEKAFGQLIAIRQQLLEMFPEVKKSLEHRKSNDSNVDENDDVMSSNNEENPSDIVSAYSDGEQNSRMHQSLASKRLWKDDASEREIKNTELASNKKMRTDSSISLAPEEFHRNFLNFRNTTIEKWYQRTKLGSAVKGKKAGYTALEQAPLKQIEHILAEQDRLLQRTRIKRSQYSIVGLPNLKQQAPSIVGEGFAKEILPEIFDDDDFYHHLLREVIERKTQNVSDPFEISRHWIEIQKLRSKIKRRVDTKASKGRRIRYDVIPKLVSFMTPHDATTFNEQARNDLFASIFGKRSMSCSSEPRANITKNDMAGFKLFS
ncbi:protein AATF-like [Varroa destructor]|uniref:Protein AATF n=1 Tax=Varroa destructor TaxID=109461 RepID=A0A7M7MAS9_VARDE|nr:protein AATF-like [Varroa destructor]